jgi:GxxExxY protein
VILSLHYDGFHLDACLRLDLPVNDAVTVELKTVENLLPVHKARALTYSN